MSKPSLPGSGFFSLVTAETQRIHRNAWRSPSSCQGPLWAAGVCSPLQTGCLQVLHPVLPQSTSEGSSETLKLNSKSSKSIFYKTVAKKLAWMERL